MGLPENHLGQGEHEIAHLRTHPKVLIFSTLAAIVVVAIAIVLMVILPAPWQPWSVILILVLVFIAVIPLFVLPLLRWLTTTYTITNHRLITRKGILTRTGHDLPLRSISNVSYEKSLTDRLFGCGSLVFTTSADQPVVLNDIPDAEEIGVRISELLSDDPRD